MLIEPIQLGRFARLRNEILQRITVERELFFWTHANPVPQGLSFWR